MSALVRLHPESWRQLRQFAKVHGVEALIAALRSIAREEVSPRLALDEEEV